MGEGAICGLGRTGRRAAGRPGFNHLGLAEKASRFSPARAGWCAEGRRGRRRLRCLRFDRPVVRDRPAPTDSGPEPQPVPLSGAALGVGAVSAPVVARRADAFPVDLPAMGRSAGRSGVGAVSATAIASGGLVAGGAAACPAISADGCAGRVRVRARVAVVSARVRGRGRLGCGFRQRRGSCLRRRGGLLGRPGCRLRWSG